MSSEKPSFGKPSARILSFPRGTKRAPSVRPVPDVVESLAKFERGPDDREDDADDYRHRMIVNAAAFLFVIALIASGIWLADTMADMRKNQDCVLSGRRGCSPVDVVPKARW
jgi:hypothetical protein